MSSAKFYVLGGGRWRELDISAGRVEGWGSARFLYVERGRLRAVRRAPVLRGLRALAAGRARTVHDGAPLSQIRHTKSVKKTRAPCSPRDRRGRCQHALYGCGVNAHFNMALQAVRVEHAAVQADPDHAPAPTATAADDGHERHINTVKKKSVAKKRQMEVAAPHRNTVRLNSSDEDLSASVMEWNRKRKMREIRGAELCKELIIAEEDVMLLRNFIEKDERNVFKVDLARFDADDSYKSKVFYKLNPLVNVERCKAIADMTWERRSQSTVTLKDFITNLGLRRVDDPSPSRTSYRMRKRRNTCKPKESESEQDKENLSSKRQRKVKARPNKVLCESVGGKPNSGRVKDKVKASEAPPRATRGSRRLEETVVVEVSDSDTTVERPEPAAPRAESAAPHKRETGGAGREYSSAEDAAIVRWVRQAGRAHLVNGNRLWRELQPEHQRLTGHFRSWHSLRNRYLRYLLPSLGALLPAPAASDLRAAAARGEIKARLPPRRHSLLALPPVTSAWARRPRIVDPTDQTESDDTTALAERVRRDARLKNVSEPTRSSRSSGASPAVTNRHAAAHAETPTYSELTKRFAKRHRSTPNSDASEGTEPEKVERRASKRLRGGKNGDSPARRRRPDEASSRSIDASGLRDDNYGNNVDTSSKQTARSSRYADRSSRKAYTSSGHAGDASPTVGSTDDHRRKPRTRRLYNPNL